MGISLKTRIQCKREKRKRKRSQWLNTGVGGMSKNPAEDDCRSPTDEAYFPSGSHFTPSGFLALAAFPIAIHRSLSRSMIF